MNLKEELIGNITGTFFVESYQRGYRWTKSEIEHLLDDIDEINDGEKYCLQPIVVKVVNGNKTVYELIDGQQRLTTLYLIMKYLSSYIDIKYSIEYTTRKSANGIIGSKQLLETIDTIDLNAESHNIDELFIKKAYSVICKWFNGDKQKMINFARKLMNNVSIIWYEVDSQEDSIDIFTRLNIGKISLTNAELVKALFLSRGRKTEQGHYSGNPYGFEDKKQHEIALQWDSMEKCLHNNKFWAFITNKKESDYPIRMELLFDIIENKPENEYSYYTFNKFCERFKKTKDKIEAWETIIRDYQQLLEWYNDFDLYHQIGYLVAIGTDIKTLLDIATDEKKHLSKSAFRGEILGSIRKSMDFGDIEYADLNYDEHKESIHRLLLLFNVETIRQKGDEDNRFPFERYKNEGTWSLEHIHAQNSESLKNNKQWKEWLELHKKSLEGILKTSEESHISEIKNLISEIDQVIEHINTNNYRGSIRVEFSDVSAKVVLQLSEDNDMAQIHSLSNMALLTVGENAAVNNSTFDAKRIKVIEMDRNGDYIPQCTRNVFLKYYSLSDTKLHYWSLEDRKYYIKAINDVLYGNTENTKLLKGEIHYDN